MATFPYFVLGPNTLLSIAGLLRGPDKTPASPAEDWRVATVDVVIPAFNEEQTIILTLASVMRQTLRPRRVLMIDDGSTDRTVACAKAFCSHHGVELTVIQRQKPIGKTPTIKRQARELDCDVEFILDGDTILESDDYIERTVQELYKAVGIASACGTILPLRRRDRRANESHRAIREFEASKPWRMPIPRETRAQMFGRAVTNLYREVLYLFLQRFIYHGEMVFFGTIANPVGCAVAYRRKYVKDLFDHFGPHLGDDLTNSEDIFIGFAMLDMGYRNIQLQDVYARTVEPDIRRLPRQVYSWSSSFLQSCFYFDRLLRGPFKALKRWRMRQRRPPRGLPVRPAPAVEAVAASTGAAVIGRPYAMSSIRSPLQMSAVALTPPPATGVSSQSGGDARGGADRRVAREPYRQAFGRERTKTYGRPGGWMLLSGAVEKVFFPAAMLIMLILRNWEGVWLTMAIDTGIGVLVLALVMKGQRLEYALKSLAVAPIRYAMLASELVTVGRFASDLWITNNRKWRK